MSKMKSLQMFIDDLQDQLKWFIGDDMDHYMQFEQLNGSVLITYDINSGEIVDIQLKDFDQFVR